MQSLQGIKYTLWIACNYYWCKTNLQIVSVTVPAKHQITQINELELTFNWKWDSTQKNHLTWKSQSKLRAFQSFLHFQKS